MSKDFFSNVNEICHVKVNVSSCQYLVDWDKGMTSEEEPNYSEMASEWKIIASVPFLDASRLYMYQ